MAAPLTRLLRRPRTYSGRSRALKRKVSKTVSARPCLRPPRLPVSCYGVPDAPLSVSLRAAVFSALPGLPGRDFPCLGPLFDPPQFPLPGLGFSAPCLSGPFPFMHNPWPLSVSLPLLPVSVPGRRQLDRGGGRRRRGGPEKGQAGAGPAPGAAPGVTWLSFPVPAWSGPLRGS